MSQGAVQDGRDIEDWLRAEQSSCGTSHNSEVPTKTHDIEMASLKRKDNRMKLTKVILALACLMSSTLLGQQAKLTDLMSKDLTNLPGKEGLMMIVDYPPGSVDPIHRHNAHAFVYVLEGSIVMQVRGGKEVTLTPGQTFFEGPDDVHVVGRNASQTKPAKFVVFLVKDKGAPVVVPAN
jgi:quercetin dioxygenase-like cupin family protein